MPYTPPSQRSPAASRPETPHLSRSNSCSKSQQYTNAISSTSPRPGSLPRSATSTTYLHKHRRSPSVKKSASFATDTSTPDASPPTSASAAIEGQGKFTTDGSLCQSPLRTKELQIQTGSLMSPPDSAQNSSDDDEFSKRGRIRSLENLAELQAAIRIIEQHRESSPNRFNEETKKVKIALGMSLPSPIPTTTEQDHLARSPLSKEARKISHSRSSTESLTLSNLPKNQFETSSNGTSDSEMEGAEGNGWFKPPMLRKKSGELVRPALRPSSAKRRPSSMPGTPTYSKAVHFDSHLEHVRHFLQVDKPLAVSAGSSPVETHNHVNEFPFGTEDSNTQSLPFEWEIRLTNFPCETAVRTSSPVKVEKVYLSADNKALIGTVTVANLSFHKLVVARFTLDYWKTTSEVVAEYNNDVRRKQINDGLDRFNFNIKIEDQANLEAKVLFFCVRYNVNGQEFWDSNNNMNFQVEFTKKAKPQLGKQRKSSAGARSLNALPRSSLSSSNSSTQPRPIHSSFDDFGSGFEPRYGHGTAPLPGLKIAGESPIRFKNPKVGKSIVPDAPSLRSTAPVQAFGNRYDFGASLSAAMLTASTVSGAQTEGASGPTLSKQNNSVRRPGLETPRTSPDTEESNESGKLAVTTSVSNATAPENPSKPAALSEKPALQSRSYNELLDKYCFFGSAKVSPRSGSNQSDDSSENKSTSEFNPEELNRSSTRSSPPKQTPLSAEDTRQSRAVTSSRVSGTSSPITGSGLGSRTASPVSFGFPYHQPMQNGFFSENLGPPAIRG